MSESKRPKRVRPRKYVMVELTDAQRAKLESLRDARIAQTGINETLAGTVRRLIMEAETPEAGQTAAETAEGAPFGPRRRRPRRPEPRKLRKK